MSNGLDGGAANQSCAILFSGVGVRVLRFQISDDLKKAILGIIEAAKGISTGISHALPLVA